MESDNSGWRDGASLGPRVGQQLSDAFHRVIWQARDSGRGSRPWIAATRTEQISRVGSMKSIGRGHHYGTVLTDLDHRRVLEVVEHREQLSEEKALECLPSEQRARFRVALDIWPAFMNAARSKALGADLVHDRFHVMKHLNEAVDKVRKPEHAELSQDSVDWLTARKYRFLKSPATWKAEEKSTSKNSAIRTSRSREHGV